ncbi:hypothetical protein, partial [Thiolapillus sp.]|uniref:hypothetical protein n=1 Tax=Thiolapillus sp. TaxID=2017437 RepID=UPI003AF64AA1
MTCMDAGNAGNAGCSCQCPGHKKAGNLAGFYFFSIRSGLFQGFLITLVHPFSQLAPGFEVR